MGINLSQVDLSNVEARQAFEVIPAGWQNAAITNTEMKPTKDGTGKYMEVTSEIIDGPYKGRKLFDRLNLENADATTVDIAFKTLKSIYNAVGKVRVSDSAELHGIPFKIKVKVRAGRKDEVTGQQYEASNDVGGYDHISSDHATGAGVGGSIAGGTAGDPQGRPAWATGAAQPPAAAPAAAPANQAVGGPAANSGPAWQPPGGGQPWEQHNAVGAAQPPAAPGAPTATAPQQVLELTPAASQGGLTLADYRKEGWTDELLVQHGHAVYKAAPAPLTAPNAPPAAPAAPGAPVTATAQDGGQRPPWAR